MKCMASRLVFVLSLGLMMGTAAGADTQQQALSDSYSCALRQHELLSDFHFYNSDPKEKTFLVSLDQSRAAGAACAKQVSTELAALGFAQISAELSAQFGQFDKLLTTNIGMLLKKGAPENEVLLEMLMHGVKIEAALAQAANELSASVKIKPNADAKKIRDLAVMMAYTSTRYVERTVQLYPREDSNEPTIDELAKKIEKNLAELQASPGLTPDMKKRLATINTKFRFIRGSLVNYNESPVAFTVKRHLKTMSALLMDMAEQLQPLK